MLGSLEGPRPLPLHLYQVAEQGRTETRWKRDTPPPKGVFLLLSTQSVNGHP